MKKILFACVLLISGCSASFAQTSIQSARVDSLVARLDEDDKKDVRNFYLSIFPMDSLAEEPLLKNMLLKNSLEKKSVISHALVYVSKENILNELVEAYNKAGDTLSQDMIVYTILGVRYKFNTTSDLKLKANKEIFPILISNLTDTLDISSIAEGIKKINGIAWLAIEKWGEFRELKDIFARDFMEISFEEQKGIQKTLLKWWKKNGGAVYWDNDIKMFTVPEKK
ncbi:MAG: hypothetical protein ACM3P0_03935 [Acidobacteriota bacterium]